MSAPAPAQVLRVLADLAPTGGANVEFGPDGNPRQRVDRLIKVGDTARVPLGTLGVFDTDTGTGAGTDIATPARPNKPALPKVSDQVIALANRARLRAEPTVLRVGWLWLTGSPAGGSAVRFPLVSAPVEVVDNPGLFGGRRLSRIGDIELTDHVADPELRRRLEADFQFGGSALHHTSAPTADPALLEQLTELTEWVAAAVAAAGHPDAELRADRAAGEHGVSVLAQVYAYLSEPPRQSATIASTLREWADLDVDRTAFAYVYGLDTERDAATDTDPGTAPRAVGDSDSDTTVGDIDSTVVLSASQRAAVATSRTEPMLVVSGPPGTGKSQTLAAIALDAVEHGQSVLIGAPSEAAVDALIALLANTPGPDPMVFGANAQRDAVASRIGQGGGPRVDDRALQRATERYRAASDAYRRLAASVGELLRAEHAAAVSDPALTLLARRATPNWFGTAADDASLAEAGRLLDRARNVGGVFAQYRSARRLALLQRHAGSTLDDLDEIARHLATARSARAATDLVTSGGLDLEGLWPRLADAGEARRTAHAEWLYAEAHSARRVDRRARGTMAAVAAAVRSGRASRREMLGRIDGAELTRALPIWIGTLRDIDDLLPRSPGMFDLVIIDEASQVDQVVAAPALVRARRAVVAGDPKQLRHVSFLSDARIAAALATHEVTDQLTAARLDVRRLSTFDLAAGAAPVQFLDEHFRSLPHLVDFSARRFYDGTLAIATRHPANDDRDCISVRTVAGTRGDDGANQAELEAVVELIRERAGDGHTIGVVSPFRGHIEALEARLLTAFDQATIDAVNLRIGTVHGFQGCECDLLIVSLAIDPAAPAGETRFVADENLMNVMITRARREIVVVTSLGTDAPGLVGEYLRHADAPPAPPSSRPPLSVLARTLVADLERSGVTVTSGYPAGHHTVDVVVGSGAAALGVLCGLHPDGPEAHIDRRLELTRAGWSLRDAYVSRWGDHPERLAVELALEATQRHDQGG
ncbi:MAG TPA: AAA domain-containing protein [Ilumatobacter sp.]|nr:AAA domain-containing protein [Ilumatobacter sp.]